MQAYVRPWVTVLFGWFRGRRDLVLENAALRQQLGDVRAPPSRYSGLGSHVLGLARAHLARLAWRRDRRPA